MRIRAKKPGYGAYELSNGKKYHKVAPVIPVFIRSSTLSENPALLP